ncbi:5016_t:CDS:2, partial [Dentiscutata erythropus]
MKGKLDKFGRAKFVSPKALVQKPWPNKNKEEERLKKFRQRLIHHEELNGKSYLVLTAVECCLGLRPWRKTNE